LLATGPACGSIGWTGSPEESLWRIIAVSFSRFFISRPAAPASRARPAVPFLPGPPDAPRFWPRVPGSRPPSFSAAFAAPDFAGLRPMVGMAGRRDDVVRRPRAGRWAGLPAGRPNRPAAGRFGVWVRVGMDSPSLIRSGRRTRSSRGDSRDDGIPVSPA